LNKPITAQGVHVVTAMFEQELCRYLGSPYAVAVDSATSAIELCLLRENVKGLEISIPERTYMSAPCSIVQAGAKVKWIPVEGTTLTGAYQLYPTRIYDSALRFTADQYIAGQLQCVSMTGCYKHLKIGKGGAILCDREEDYEFFKRARNSGRGEMSYHLDKFESLGRNVYMQPTVAALGLLLMGQFYEITGEKIHNKDKTLPYPKLSNFPIYNT
jgi:dTDP-4-amino-4,6-dideoxygalactose transaminase